MEVFLTTFGLTGVFVYILIDLLVLHQDRGEKLAAWIAKLFSWTGKQTQKVATAMSVQTKINSFASSVDTEVRGLLPFGVKIKWIEPSIDKQAFIKDNQVVVMLSYHENEDENLSKSTSLYMSKAVIPEARPHIDQKLARAIDLMMTKKALYSFYEARSALDHFITETLRPETDADADTQAYCQAIDTTDERGLFTRILLRELLELGRRKAGHSQTGQTVFEANQFVKHLDKIAQKEKGQDVNPNFISNEIRVSIIFVARPEKVVAGVSQYVKAINIFGIRKNSRVIYVFARRDNISLAKQVVAQAKKQYVSLDLVHEEVFEARKDYKLVKNYCAIFKNKKVY